MFKMWIKALKVIPRISKEEWETLDMFSRWLIAIRIAFYPGTDPGCCLGESGVSLVIQSGDLWHYLLKPEAEIQKQHGTGIYVGSHQGEFNRTDKAGIAVSYPVANHKVP